MKIVSPMYRLLLLRTIPSLVRRCAYQTNANLRSLFTKDVHKSVTCFKAHQKQLHFLKASLFKKSASTHLITQREEENKALDMSTGTNTKANSGEFGKRRLQHVPSISQHIKICIWMVQELRALPDGAYLHSTKQSPYIRGV